MSERQRFASGAWRHGRRWKVWAAGPWFNVEVGLGRVWLSVGRLSFQVDRGRPQAHITLGLWRGERVSECAPVERERENA